MLWLSIAAPAANFRRGASLNRPRMTGRRATIAAADRGRWQLAVAAPLAPAAVRAGHSGWEWASPLPQGHTIRALAFQGDTGYAVGDFGHGAQDHRRRLRPGPASPPGTTRSLDHVAVIDADSVVGRGRLRGAPLRRRGRQLQGAAVDGRRRACARRRSRRLRFRPTSVDISVLVDGAVWRTDDGGATWTAARRRAASRARPMPLSPPRRGCS